MADKMALEEALSGNLGLAPDVIVPVGQRSSSQTAAEARELRIVFSSDKDCCDNFITKQGMPIYWARGPMKKLDFRAIGGNPP
ncbi:hypothetical protein [Pararhizobium sp.]|uniref:hypothetical protein n=1 Tax=Pararhizobium sp. TaxID=1977563 RepID=UPI00271E726C|nr:hypothetical protein [Pararhizobium sp.]MDO9415865.1 hypothetical protein [Pararhizobium sp.]